MDNPREIYKEISTDDLASSLQTLKDSIAALRQESYYIEDELRDRMLANDASVLLGGAWKVKSTVDREVVWDQAALRHANDAALRDGLGDQFSKAFPMKYDCSVRNLNALLKLGGETAKAIERARASVKEKLKISVEGIK